MKKKISDNNEESLEKHLEMRKEFETEINKTQGKGITHAGSSLHHNPRNNPRRALSHVAPKIEV